MKNALYNLVDHIASLQVNETASKAIALNDAASLAFVMAELPATKEKLRNSINSAIARASARTEGRYVSQITECITSASPLLAANMYVVALITRVE